MQSENVPSWLIMFGMSAGDGGDVLSPATGVQGCHASEVRGFVASLQILQAVKSNAPCPASAVAYPSINPSAYLHICLSGLSAMLRRDEQGPQQNPKP